MDGAAEKLRPWLQDFSLGGMSPDGPDQVPSRLRPLKPRGLKGGYCGTAVPAPTMKLRSIQSRAIIRIHDN